MCYQCPRRRSTTKLKLVDKILIVDRVCVYVWLRLGCKVMWACVTSNFGQLGERLNFQVWFFLLINIRFGELGLRGARQGQGRLRGSKSGFLIVLSLDMLLTHVIRTKNPFG